MIACTRSLAASRSAEWVLACLRQPSQKHCERSASPESVVTTCRLSWPTPGRGGERARKAHRFELDLIDIPTGHRVDDCGKILTHFGMGRAQGMVLCVAECPLGRVCGISGAQPRVVQTDDPRPRRDAMASRLGDDVANRSLVLSIRFRTGSTGVSSNLGESGGT
jgi:hypothetical protein